MTENNEVPHADLIARLHRWCDRVVSPHAHTAMIEAADALAALGDTVPRERYEALCRDWADVMRLLTEARAERDTLAHFFDEARRIVGTADLRDFLDAAPAVSLALHDAEVWWQGYEAGFERGVLVQSAQASGEPPVNPYRAAAISDDTIKENK